MAEPSDEPRVLWCEHRRICDAAIAMNGFFATLPMGAIEFSPMRGSGNRTDCDPDQLRTVSHWGPGQVSWECRGMKPQIGQDGRRKSRNLPVSRSCGVHMRDDCIKDGRFDCGELPTPLAYWAIAITPPAVDEISESHPPSTIDPTISAQRQKPPSGLIGGFFMSWCRQASDRQKRRAHLKVQRRGLIPDQSSLSIIRVARFLQQNVQSRL